MNIGWSTWEPGLTGSTKVSAGGAAWTRHLFEQFKREGHQVIWLQPSLEAPEGTQRGSLADCDVAFICWRWAMPERPERQAAYDAQNVILTEAEKLRTPLIIHDEDYKMEPWEIDRLARQKNVALTRPELFPHKPFQSLIFPNPYMFDQVRLPFTGDVDLVYIGNNYERYGQAQLFLAPFSKSFTTRVYGNWMEPGAGRQLPEIVRHDFPEVDFAGRLPQEDVIKVLGAANSTVHLFKPEYGRTGFMTIRWAEAAAAGIPSFIPANMRLPGIFQNAMRQNGWLVRDGKEMTDFFMGMKPNHWLNGIVGQRLFVNANMRWEPWLELAGVMTRNRR